MNAAYGQLINSGVNELIATYGETTFSTDHNHPTNIVLLFSREINFAQIQFTLAGVIAENKHVKSIVAPILNEIHRTIIDKPFNFGNIRNQLIIHYDKCHAFYTKGLANREDYAKLCFKNVHERGRHFETAYYTSFQVFQSFFNFAQSNDENAEKILETIYNLREKDGYKNSWAYDVKDENTLRNTLSFDETVEKIVQKVAHEISILCPDLESFGKK